jgi:hypothetical protein
VNSSSNEETKQVVSIVAGAVVALGGPAAHPLPPWPPVPCPLLEPVELPELLEPAVPPGPPALLEPAVVT